MEAIFPVWSLIHTTSYIHYKEITFKFKKKKKSLKDHTKAVSFRTPNQSSNLDSAFFSPVKTMLICLQKAIYVQSR